MRCAGASSGIIRRARRLQLIVLASTNRWHGGSKNCWSQIAARLRFGSSAVRACSGSRRSRSIRRRTRKARTSARLTRRFSIGPAEAAKSYLNIAAIIAAAKQSGADAIHPGYGFLSERPEFAQAAADAQIVFVGPRPDVMAALGNKVAARRIAVAAGVPVVPGIETAEISAARDFAAQVSYPILIKAAAGGGGRGMRVVAEARRSSRALWKRRRAKLRRHSATAGYSSRSISRIRGISKSKFLATNTAAWSHSASAIAQSSGGIRRLSKSRRRRDSPTRCARK